MSARFKCFLAVTTGTLVMSMLPSVEGRSPLPADDSTTSTTVKAAAQGGAKLASASSESTKTRTIDPLILLLAQKGVITKEDVKALTGASTPAQQRDRLVALLHQKGLLTDAEVAAITGKTGAQTSNQKPTRVASARSAYLPSQSGQQAKVPAEQRPVRLPPPHAPTSFMARTLDTVAKGFDAAPPPEAPVPTAAAVAPLRVLPVTPPAKGGLVSAFRIGPVSVTPYGFIKATAIHDSSMPNGDDFPYPGLFLDTSSVLNTGPTQDPEFHLKARSTRFGMNFEWPDLSPKLILTGRFESDFEGNFSEVDNRDISSIRSNAFQLRLAYARLDYAASDKTDIFFQGGQDWSIFGSSALPNLLETTFLGAFWGDVWERDPQMRVGMVRNLGGSRKFTLSPEVAIMLPGSGEIEKLGSFVACGSPVAPATVVPCTFFNGLANQLGQGERQGADSDRPELEARVALQWQLDKAPGVAPAQILVSGFQSRRRSITTSADYAYNTSVNMPLPPSYVAAFPNGFTAGSDQWGGQVALQLPTRWATLAASAYRGGDLRFFFGGQIDSYFTDTSGLTNLHTVYQTVDNVAGTASGPMVLGTNAAGQVVVAPQRPIRAFGGFVNLGLPLSRWFNASPEGRNSGWQLYLDVGKDQVVHRDGVHQLFLSPGVASPGALPLSYGSMAAATLYYKVNTWCTFGFEQSIYADHLLPELGGAYTIAGRPSRTWIDRREEAGPIFTF
jgi:hypothetical protein